MKIVIDTDVLKDEKLSLGEFLILLMGYYGLSFNDSKDSLLKKKLVDDDLFTSNSVVLSDNTKDLISRVLMKSIEKDTLFVTIAKRLQDIYPDGIKPGTTYPWKGNVEEIAQKLRVLRFKHNFIFTPTEAARATEEYVNSFGEDKTRMKLLKYFLLRTKGDREIVSDFMSIIENNRTE